MFSLLDEADCEDWVLRVLLLKRHWRQRHAEVPFFSLGMAAYLDCVAGRAGAAYRDAPQRQQSNQLLETHFGPLLQQVTALLQTHFQLPARLAREAAFPGFHIHLPHPAFADPVASVHRDLQYRDVFPKREIAAEDVFTFTLPLSTPPGSGLNLWRQERDPPEFIPYRSGRLVLHSGLTTHQAVLRCNGDLERITLQGHAVRLDGELLLYW
ncbi:hypothetical protein [Collimonas silvisoli]|uniref:hypothetical protein n=1 Tax=Collimonas silvisoli TaxID=2825884 RepID=UPI001B8D8E0C|nr:hypothetical protein [Collimonas silvisoli]